MAGTPILFRDFAYVFVAALAGGLLARRLRQPLILGYVLGGILIGPFTPGPSVSDIHSLELLAELGVILLMYSIGLEFSAAELLRVKWVAIAGAPLGILMSVGMSLLAGRVLGWSTPQAIAIGAIISVASTMVLSRLLIDRGELRSPHGRIMIGITLMEDMAVVIMTVLLPNLGSFAGDKVVDLLVGLAKALLLLIPVGFAAVKLVPRLMTLVARTQSEELYLLVALALGFATAAITQAVGLSLALGAFLAGMIISESEHAHETLAQLLPLRDTFVALFFVTMGALIVPQSLFSNLYLLGTMVVLVIAGKFLVWTAVVLLFRYPWRTAVLVGIGLTQIGEFSFVLVQVARSAGIVSMDVYNATLAASLISILLNAMLIRIVLDILTKKRAAEAAQDVAADEVELSQHAVFCGFGRIGSLVGTALEAFGIPYAVLENNPDIVAALRSRGVPCVFGDAARRHVLAQVGIPSASLVMVTVPEAERAVQIVRTIRQVNAAVTIVARASLKNNEASLLEAGANQLVQPEFEAAAALIASALDRFAISQEQVRSYLEWVRYATGATSQATHPGEFRVPEVRQITVGRDYASETLAQARIRERFGVTVVAIDRDGEVAFNPASTMRIRAGDKLRVFGLREQLDEFSASAKEGGSGQVT